MGVRRTLDLDLIRNLETSSKQLPTEQWGTRWTKHTGDRGDHKNAHYEYWGGYMPDIQVNQDCHDLRSPNWSEHLGSMR